MTDERDLPTASEEHDRLRTFWETRGWWQDEDACFPLWIYDTDPAAVAPSLKMDPKSVGKWLAWVFGFRGSPDPPASA